MGQEGLVIKSKRQYGDASLQTSIRIKQGLLMQLDQIAEQAGYSRNELIGMILDYAVHHYTIEEL